jgi:hypothetical protein
MVHLISSGSPFERDMAYSRALVDGDWIFVSGTTGYDYATMTISDDVATQADQCFRNIAKALEQAGASLANVARALHPAQRRTFRSVGPQCANIWATFARPRPCSAPASPTRR